jgi:hypothetical protein
MLGLFRSREVKTAITSNGFSLAMLTDEELAGFHSVELSFDFPTKEEIENSSMLHRLVKESRRGNAGLANLAVGRCNLADKLQGKGFGIRLPR